MPCTAVVLLNRKLTQPDSSRAVTSEKQNEMESKYDVPFKIAYLRGAGLWGLTMARPLLVVNGKYVGPCHYLRGSLI